jgi:hypothetical protein
MMAMTPPADEPLVSTRRSLHALAVHVISPLRVQATGNEIALQVRPEGFGTPDLPDGSWIATRGPQLVRVDPSGDEQSIAITSLRAAAHFAGLAEPAASALSDEPLEIHAGATHRLADVWATGAEALTAFAADPATRDPSPVLLWPEHFNIAIDAGTETDNTRATYGVSPGDDDHTEPYAYVSPWTAPTETGPSTFWNATGFTGAERPVTDADDDTEIRAFFRAARDLLQADD